MRKGKKGLYGIPAGQIITYTGHYINPLDPDPDDIHLEDVAHALSLICRFTGHVKHFYSVAQHSVHVSENVPKKDALWGLLHDASEAYLADLARPIKHMPGLGDVYRECEARLQAAICKRFDLPEKEPESIKDADILLLHTEQTYLMPNTPERHKAEETLRELSAWEPWLAKERFLKRYAELTDKAFRTQAKVFFKNLGEEDIARMAKAGKGN